MRAVILIAVISFALAGCGKNDQAATNQIVGENLTAENIVANDVTAIDAVTGDAANMAADVDYNAIDNLDENDVNSAAPERPGKARKEPTTVEASPDNSSGNSSGDSSDDSSDNATD
jgi:hypothetical protein